MGESHAGLFVVLIGIIALVFGGIGISLMAENQAQGRGREQSLHAVIADNAATIADLERSVRSSRQRAVEYEKEHRRIAEDLHHEQVRIASLTLKSEALENERESIEQAIADAEAALGQGRLAARDAARQRLVGDFLGEVRFRGARRYTGVRVTGFGPGTMRFSHDGGVSSIPLSQLSKDLKSRIFWDPSEAADEDRAATAESRDSQPSFRPFPRKTKAAPDPHQVSQAQARFSAALASREEVKRALEEANFHLDGPRRSPPGSLETYADRVNRLTRLLQSKEALLDQCRTQLRTVSPHDPLLSAKHRP